jgi:tetratricopeptide (TPR) repeat protein
MQILIQKGELRDALQQADAILHLPEANITERKAIRYDNVSTSYQVATMLHRADFLKKMARRKEAENAYDTAVATEPSALTYARRARFRLFGDLGIDLADDPLVESDLLAALSFDPKHWFAHETVGYRAFYQSRYEAAVDSFARAVELIPQRGQTRWFRALALRALGRMEEATADAIAAVTVDLAFFRYKAEELKEKGYLREVGLATDPTPIVHDAVRACMLDRRCG